jgi:hypothetical protein
MNAPAIVLLLLVPRSDVGGEVVSTALTALMSGELQPRLAVQVDVDRPGQLDVKTLSHGRQAPNFAARMVWQDERRLSATLVVREVVSGSIPYRSISRAVAFAPADAPGEKGRALGLVLTSMLRSLVGLPEPGAESQTSAASQALSTATPDAQSQRQSLRLLGALLPVSGSEWAAGGELGYRLALSPHLGCRASALLRGGRVSGIKGQVSTVGAGLGADAPLIRSPSWTVAATLDVLAIRQGWTGTISSSDDSSRQQGDTVRWNAIFRPGVEGQLSLARWLSIVGFVGLEVAASKESSTGDDTIVRSPSQVYPLLMLGTGTAF